MTPLLMKTRGRRPLAVLVIVTLALATAGARQSPPQTFRGSVDLIAVDVQVVDRQGQPVTGLAPEKFEVTINGRKRRVVSADLMSIGASTAGPIGTVPPAGLPAAVATETPLPPPSRLVLLAVDTATFPAAGTRGAMTAARAFIDRLPPGDQVGLFAYPQGPKIDPTTEHVAVTNALDKVIGRRRGVPEGDFHLRPSEVVDLSMWVNNEEAVLKRVQDECGDGVIRPIDHACVRRQPELAVHICGVDGDCHIRLALAVQGASMDAEGDALASLGMLRALLHGLAAVPGRKTMVLVSGGMLASDVPGGRPDLNDVGIQVGRAAAEANVAVYTLFVDQGAMVQYTAETRRANVTIGNASRDSAILGRFLEQFSGSAGGALLPVPTGNGESQFDRILAESSAYYLLGVEPAEADRDGRTHEMRVKVAQRDVSVRGRSWVVVPKRGAAAVSAADASGAAKPASPVTAPVPRPLPPSVQPLAAAFERADYAAVQRGLAATADLANVIGDFRASDNPWPAAPKRTAVFALELSLAGLASRNGFARDQGISLLAESAAIARQPGADDPFECAWYLTAVAGLEGLRIYNPALVLATRGLQRCAAEPRFVLARAWVTEQQQAGDSRAGDVLALYDAAMKFPETSPEARVRAAWFAYRAGEQGRASELMGSAQNTSPDPAVRHVHDLVKGHVLRARGDAAAAVKAYRSALAVWPGAQSASVALMTLLLERGDRSEAERLAEAVGAAPATQTDPWPAFGQGDFRAYPAMLAALRAQGR